MKKLLTLLFALFLTLTFTSCNKSEELKAAMTYSEFMAAEADEEVVIEGFISAKQSWWQDQVTMYLTTETAGEGYLIYEFNCTEEENNTTYAIGKYIHIEATKTIYAGLHEITGATVTLAKTLETTKTPANAPYNISSKLADLEPYQNSYFTATLTVVEFTTEDTNANVAESKAYGYKGDEPNDDLYFTLSDGTNNLNCCVEVYLTGTSTDVYNAVKNLTVGSTVTVEGYLYWWNGANPHVVSLTTTE